MEEQVRLLLAELEQWGQENDERVTERSQKMLNLEPETAQLLSIFIQNGSCQNALEVGTSNGYSTIWLAWSLQQTGGHLVSLERSPEKYALAHANLQRAGLRERVTLLEGDAGELLATLGGPFEFVFLDADRTQYPSYLSLILPLLSPCGLLLADNVHSHPEEIAPYLEVVKADKSLQHVVLPVGKGLSVALKS